MQQYVMAAFSRVLDSLVNLVFDAPEIAAKIDSFPESWNVFGQGLFSSVSVKSKWYKNRNEDKAELANLLRGRGITALTLLLRALRDCHFPEAVTAVEDRLETTLLEPTQPNLDQHKESVGDFMQYLKRFQPTKLQDFCEHLEHMQTEASAGSLHSSGTSVRYGLTPRDCYLNRDNDDNERVYKAFEDMLTETRGALLIKGEGAIGKSLLVAHNFVHDDSFLSKFSIGTVYWLNVWRYSDSGSNLAELFQDLGQIGGSSFQASEAKAKFIRKLQDTSWAQRRTLIVLDDVFSRFIFAQTSNLADHVYLVAISRTRTVMDWRGRCVEIRQVGDGFFAELFSQFGWISQSKLAKVKAACWGLPLIGQLVAAELRNYDTDMAADEFCTQIIRHNVDIDVDWTDDRNFDSICNLFIFGFQKESDIFQFRFLTLLLFSKGTCIPLEDLALLWQVSVEKASKLATDYLSRSWARVTYGSDGNINSLSLHDYLFKSAFKFSLEKLTPVDEHIVCVRRALLRQLGIGGADVLADAIRLGRFDLVNTFCSVLTCPSGNPEDRGTTLFEVCGRSPSPVASFFSCDVKRFVGKPCESNESLVFACKILNLMLICDKKRAMAVIDQEDLVPKLLSTVANGRKASENALSISLRYGLLRDLLLENGADLGVVDDRGNNILMEATTFSLVGTLRTLLTRCHENVVNAVNSDGESAFDIAYKCGWTAIVRVFVESGKLSDSKCGKSAKEPKKTQGIIKMSKLEKAINEGDSQGVAELLHEQGGDVNSPVNENLVPLHLAAKQGHSRIVETLIKLGATTDARTDRQATPLHVACKAGHQQVVDILLRHGADLNAFDFIQWTPLHLASRNGHRSVVASLIKHGAEIDVGDAWHSTPLLIASFSGNQDVVAVLLENEADVDAKTTHGWTALHVAAREGHEAIVTTLLNHGATLDATDDFQNTPLLVACDYDHPEIARMLLDRGANADARNSSGETPLTAAKRSKSHKTVRIFEDRCQAKLSEKAT